MKYKPTIIKTIADTLARTGDRRAAMEAANISEETFYQWMKKPEFSEVVLESEKHWRVNLPQKMRRQAQKAFEDYLFGRVEETWTTVEGKRTTVRTVRRGVPQWAIERVLGKPNDLFDALKILLDYDVIPEESLDLLESELETATGKIKNILRGDIGGDTARNIDKGVGEKEQRAASS